MQHEKSGTIYLISEWIIGSLYHMNIKMLYLGTYTRITYIYMKFINGKIMRISKLSDEKKYLIVRVYIILYLHADKKKPNIEIL